MSVRRWAWVAALALVTGCKTASPPPAPLPRETGAGQAAVSSGIAVETTWQELVEDALDGAGDAVEQGDGAEFDDCEAVLVETLSHQATPSSTDANFVNQSLDELQRLRDELAAAQEDESGDQYATPEVPPEPGPVPEAQVAAAQAKATKERYDLPVIINSQVASLIDFYSGPHRDKFIASLERGSRYIPYIRQQLRDAGLPEDLAFLPLVESAFRTRARSRASAQGMWQFVRGTARLYGLRCDGLIDERNDPYLSTRAAVAHLADLHDIFNNWELVLAAYNSGAGKVSRAVRRAHGDNDFWAISRYLPRETRSYVPAFWAALVVAKNPTAYGLPEWHEQPECVGRVPVSGALDLQVLADRVPLSADQLSDLNPALIHGLTSPQGNYQLAVPCGDEDLIAEAIAAIPPNERVRRFMHTVRRGDTVGALARRYGSSVGAIMAANGIRNPRRLRIGQTLVIPRTPGTSTRSASAGPAEEPREHTVRRGDTLADLARRYGSSVTTIMAANDIHDPDRLRVGQRLTIPGRNGSRLPASDPPASVEPPRTYTVRRGDTLYTIARRFGISVSEIKRRNALGGTLIHPGDVLRLGP
jgi:membrane-bound lytic murein transglycosylase D